MPKRDGIVYLDDLLFMNQSSEGLGLDMATAPARESRLCNQSRKVLLHSNPELGVSRLCGEHSGYVSAPVRLQGGVNKIPLQQYASAWQSLSKGPIPADWKVDSFYTGNISCLSALPSPSTSETTGFSPTQGLRCSNSLIERGQGGITVVGSPPECLERTCNSAPLARDRDGCLVTGLGHGLSRGANMGAVVPDGEETPHKLFRAPSRILCCEELHKGSIMCPCETTTLWQWRCQPSRGYSLSCSVQSGFGPVGMGSQSAYCSQRRTPFQPSEYQGRLPISSFQRLEQLEIMPRGVSRSNVDLWALCHRPFRGPPEFSVASVFQLEAGPGGTRLGCSSAGLVKREKLCFHFFLPVNAIASKVTGTRGGVNTCHSCVAHASVVPQFAGSVSVITSSSAHKSQSVTRSSGADAPPNREPDSSFSRVACTQRSLQSEGICADVEHVSVCSVWRSSANWRLSCWTTSSGCSQRLSILQSLSFLIFALCVFGLKAWNLNCQAWLKLPLKWPQRSLQSMSIVVIFAFSAVCYVIFHVLAPLDQSWTPTLLTSV